MIARHYPLPDAERAKDDTYTDEDGEWTPAPLLAMSIAVALGIACWVAVGFWFWGRA